MQSDDASSTDADQSHPIRVQPKQLQQPPRDPEIAEKIKLQNIQHETRGSSKPLEGPKDN